MRISDWSSDVCSSDLGAREPRNSRFCLFIPEDDGCQDKNFESQIFFGNHHAGSSLGTSDSKSFAPRSCYPTTWARNAFSPPRRRSGSLLFWCQPAIRGLNWTWRTFGKGALRERLGLYV